MSDSEEKKARKRNKKNKVKEVDEPEPALPTLLQYDEKEEAAAARVPAKDPEKPAAAPAQAPPRQTMQEMDLGEEDLEIVWTNSAQ